MRRTHISRRWLVVALLTASCAIGWAAPAAAQSTDGAAELAPPVVARSVETSPESVATRLVLGTLAGWGTGLLGGSIGAALPFAIGGCLDQLPVPPLGCGVGLAAGGFLGLVLATPLGPLGVADILRGAGSYAGSLLGALAGAALAGLVFALASEPILETDGGGIGPMLALAALPALGASIAIELETAAR